MITIAKYWQRWSDPRLVVLVLNNRDLSYVTWEQRVQAGDPKFEAAQQLPNVPYAQIAALMGLDGVRVEQPDQLDAAMDRAFSARQPFVLDVLTDGNIPPLPPHITLKQARQFTRALAGGEPELGQVLKNSVREVVASVVSS